MTIFRRAHIAMLAVILPAVGSAQSSVTPAGSARLHGRVVDPGGSAAPGATVYIERYDPGALVRETFPMTDQTGVFSFQGILGNTYRISLGPTKKARKIVRPIAGQDIDIGDLVLETCETFPGGHPEPLKSPPELTGDLTAQQIVIRPHQPEDDSWMFPEIKDSAERPWFDSSVDLPACWTGPSLTRRSEWEHLCDLAFDQYISAEMFAGAKVKCIRVDRYNPALSADQIRDEVRRVWLGKFLYVTCSIAWAEPTMWNVKAEIEFADGKHSWLLTDGGHVQLQDHEGKYWYFREWPAVD